jgi:hypothetical protein
MGDKVDKCEITPHLVWPIAESLKKIGVPKAPSLIHSPLGSIYY